MVYSRWDGQMAINGEEKQINYRTLKRLRAMTGSPGYFRIFLISSLFCIPCLSWNLILGSPAESYPVLRIARSTSPMSPDQMMNTGCILPVL